MTAQNAFRQAFLTVGVAALLVYGVAFLLVPQLHSADWPIFLLVILLPAVLLIPLIYHRYKSGYRQQSRRWSIVAAMLSGALGIGYIVEGLIAKANHQSWFTWLMAASWLLMAMEHLRRAYKIKKEEAELPTAS